MLSRILTRSFFVAVALTAVTAASAYAGKYHAYTCRTPSGAVASAEGWSGSLAKQVYTDDYAIDSCPEGGALITAFGESTKHYENEEALWTFTTPSFATLTAATLWRATQLGYRSGEEAFYQAWLSGPIQTKIFDSCIGGIGCTNQGVIGEPFASSNKVTVPSTNLGAHLIMTVSCGAPVKGVECGNGFGHSNGYAVAEYLYAADLVLEQTTIPAVGTPSGPLVSETPIHGTSDIIFTATDPGSGIYKAVFNVDGSVVQETVINENGGKCHNVGGTEDGLPAYLYIQPCLKEVSADVGLETTKLTNGHHHVIVSVTDAADNSAYVLDREVEVLNKFPLEFRWKVNGAALTEGKAKEFTAKAAPVGAGKTFVLKGKYAGESVQLQSSKLKVASGAAIKGGVPGANSETLTLEGVTVVKPKKCEVKEDLITTKPLASEIVEGVSEGKGTESPELLLAPKEGTSFASIEFVGAECPIKGTTAPLTGSTLANLSPGKGEAETLKLTFGKAAEKPYKTSKGVSGAAELVLGIKGATLEGEAEMTLVGKEPFGAF